MGFAKGAGISEHHRQCCGHLSRTKGAHQKADKPVQATEKTKRPQPAKADWPDIVEIVCCDIRKQQADQSRADGI